MFNFDHLYHIFLSHSLQDFDRLASCLSAVYFCISLTSIFHLASWLAWLPVVYFQSTWVADTYFLFTLVIVTSLLCRSTFTIFLICVTSITILFFSLAHFSWYLRDCCFTQVLATGYLRTNFITIFKHFPRLYLHLDHLKFVTMRETQSRWILGVGE